MLRKTLLIVVGGLTLTAAAFVTKALSSAKRFRQLSWCLRNRSRESTPKPQYSGPLTGYLEANNLRVVTTPDDRFIVVSDRGVPVTDPAETATAAALAAVYCPFDGGGGA